MIAAELSRGVRHWLLLVHLLLLNRLLLVHRLLMRWLLNFGLLERGLRLLCCLDITLRASCKSAKASCSIGNAVFVNEVSCKNSKSAIRSVVAPRDTYRKQIK